MTAQDHLERRLVNHFVAEAPARAPDWVLAAVLSDVERVQQRRPGFWSSWRIVPMSKPVRAVVALAIVLLAALAVALSSSAGRRSNNSDLTRSFTSPINGYSIDVPSGWTVHVAKTAWPSGQEINDGNAPYLDQFVSTDGTLFVTSQPVAAGDSSAWAVGQFPMNAFWFPAEGCQAVVLSPIQISGASGNLDASCPSNGYRADVASRGRGYVFILRGTLHDEAWFRKLLATVVLPG